jgi:hypothetical protein
LIIARDIDSMEKIDYLLGSLIEGFTIGTAFYNRAFVPQGSYAEEVSFVLNRIA